MLFTFERVQYSEITSSNCSTPPTPDSDMYNSDEAFNEMEADVGHTLDEVASVVLNARTTTDVTQLLQVEDEAAFEEEDQSDPLPAIYSSATHSRLASRISSRHCNIDWD